MDNNKANIEGDAVYQNRNKEELCIQFEKLLTQNYEEKTIELEEQINVNEEINSFLSPYQQMSPHTPPPPGPSSPSSSPPDPPTADNNNEQINIPNNNFSNNKSKLEKKHLLSWIIKNSNKKMKENNNFRMEHHSNSSSSGGGGGGGGGTIYQTKQRKSLKKLFLSCFSNETKRCKAASHWRFDFPKETISLPMTENIINNELINGGDNKNKFIDDKNYFDIINTTLLDNQWTMVPLSCNNQTAEENISKNLTTSSSSSSPPPPPLPFSLPPTQTIQSIDEISNGDEIIISEEKEEAADVDDKLTLSTYFNKNDYKNVLSNNYQKEKDIGFLTSTSSFIVSQLGGINVKDEIFMEENPFGSKNDNIIWSNNQTIIPEETIIANETNYFSTTKITKNDEENLFETKFNEDKDKEAIMSRSSSSILNKNDDAEADGDDNAADNADDDGDDNNNDDDDDDDDEDNENNYDEDVLEPKNFECLLEKIHATLDEPIKDRDQFWEKLLKHQKELELPKTEIQSEVPGQDEQQQQFLNQQLIETITNLKIAESSKLSIHDEKLTLDHLKEVIEEEGRQRLSIMQLFTDILKRQEALIQEESVRLKDLWGEDGEMELEKLKEEAKINFMNTIKSDIKMNLNEAVENFDHLNLVVEKLKEEELEEELEEEEEEEKEEKDALINNSASSPIMFIDQQSITNDQPN